MEITIKRYSRKLSYEDAATLDEFRELVKRTERSLDREQRRHWDGRECDECIIAAQDVLPYIAYSYRDWYRTQTEKCPLPEEYHYSWLVNVTEMFNRRAPGNTCLSALALSHRSISTSRN